MSNLAHYNQNDRDRTYPDHEETVLGHMVFEMGIPLSDAAQRLKPWVKSHTKQADRAKTIGLFLTGGGIVGSITLAATLGIGVGSGFGAIIPFVAGLWNLTHKLQSDKEHMARDAEYLLLSTCPELVKLIYGLAQRGMPREVIVEAYDDLVHNFQANYSQINATGCLDGIDLGKEGIGQAFKDLIEDKMNMEVFGQEVFAEFDQFDFTTLYQSEPKKALASARATETEQARSLPLANLPTVAPFVATPDLTVEQFIETTPTNGRLADESETIAIAILDGLVSSQRSTLLIGGTGSGKSVTQAYLLVNLLKRCPDGEVRVISQKADRFAGLADIGRVTLFDQFNPGETLSVIDRVWSEYDRRRKLPEQNRVGLPPLRLLLCDWLSINAALESCAKDPEIKESRYLSKLIDVIYNGRELNVCLWIDLQSFNLAAIGMKADANSRRNFNLVGLGNYYVDEFGGVNESYGVLANMIQNRYFVDNDIQREKLMREFNRLKPISQANSRPIVFTTLEPARVALMADLRQYKTMQVVNAQPTAQPVPTDDPWQEQEYEISTKEMNQPTAQEWNPQTWENLAKLIGAVMASDDPRKDAFLRFLSDLQPGKDVSSLAADPAFLQIARFRKIISKEGVVI